MPSCRAAACVLRLSPARRSASALNASSYLRRLSGDDPLVLVAMTEEIYVLLLSTIPRPPQTTTNSSTLTNSLTSGQGDDIHILTSNAPQTEPHISIDKSNPNNLLVSANTYSQGYYYSNDGGTTWFGSDALPNSGQVGGDPSTSFDAGGNAYISTLTGPIDSYLVQSSANKGATWTNQVLAAPRVAPNYFDKEMIAADNTPSSPFANNVYGTWTDFTGNVSVQFNRSTNRGQTFSAPIVLSRGFGQGANVQTGPNGEVYVCWANYGTGAVPANGIGFARSTNGGVSFTVPAIAFSYTGIRVAGVNNDGRDPIFNNTRTNDFPAMAVDKGTVHGGRIYIVYSTKENGNGKAIVQVRFSDNQGGSWSPAVTASIPTGRQNWLPWIAVDDCTGDVSVVYYSFDTASGFETNTYVAYSSDGGASFNNLKVSDVSHTTASLNNPAFKPTYTGDYIGITAYGGKAYPVWSDNRSGTWQLYTSPVSYASITGPSQICISNTATYTVSGLPVASVIWSSSNTSIATINATSGVATGVGNGLVTFTATNSSGCAKVTKPVQIGPASATDIIGMDPSTYFSAGQTVTLSINEFALGYNWSIYGGTIVGSSTDQSVTVQLDNCFSGQTANNDFDANVTLTDGCGTGPIYHEHTYATCSGGISPVLSIASNPASSTTEVFLSDKSDMTKRVAIKELKIIDSWGTIKYAAKYDGGNTSVVLDISSLPNNLYTVAAFDGKNWINSKLVKN